MRRFREPGPAPGALGARESLARALGPIRVATYGVTVYLVALIVAPLRIVHSPSIDALAYVGVGYLAFCAGALIVRRPRSARPTTPHHRRQFWIVTAVALAGIAARLYDRYIIRGGALAQELMERRQLVEGVGSNFFSIVAAVLVPFCFVALYVWLAWNRTTPASKVLLALATALFFFPAVDALLIASRSLLLVTAGLLFLYLVYFGVVRLSIKAVLSMIAAALGGLSLSAAVFLARLEAMHMDPLASSMNSVYAFTVQPADWISNALASSTPGSIGFFLMYGVLNTTQYLVHGLLEFFYLFDNFSAQHTFGALTFSVYYKFVAIVVGLPFEQGAISSAAPRIGVFTSFFGPLYVDFGWLGPVLMFAFGALARRLHWGLRLDDGAAIPLYLYVVVVIAFFPIVNLVVTAQGLFSLTSFTLFLFFSRDRRPSWRT